MDATMTGFLVQAVAGRGLHCRINWGWKCRFGNDGHVLFNYLLPIDLSYVQVKETQSEWRDDKWKIKAKNTETQKG